MAVTKASEIIEYLASLPPLSIREIQGSHAPGREYPALGNSPVVVAAHGLNLSTVSAKLRKDGTPYADHPVRVALLLEAWFANRWPRAQVDVTKACGLVHDALEEGPGVSVSSALFLRDALVPITGDKATANEIAFASVVLTEPGLDYPRLVGIADKAKAKLLNKACLIHQICTWCTSTSLEAKSIAATAIADKLVNLFDTGYISDPTRTPLEQRDEAMAAYLGSLGFALLEFEKSFPRIADRSGALVEFLKQALLALEIQIPAQKVTRPRYQEKVAELRGLWIDTQSTLLPLIRSRLETFEAALKR